MALKEFPLLTIDGPSASGKSSVARKLAEKLDWKWLSTGIFYRGLAWMAIEKQVNFQREEDILRLLQQEPWSVDMDSSCTRFYHENREVTEALSQNKVGVLSSELSRYSSVRQFLLAPQRECYKRLACSSTREGGFIGEGRDCGTVIFPQAHLKVYLTAEEGIRTKRRAKEWGLSPGDIRESQRKRDERDQKRKKSPLKRAEGAWVIDSSEMDLESVAHVIEKKIHSLHLISK